MGGPWHSYGRNLIDRLPGTFKSWTTPSEALPSTQNVSVFARTLSGRFLMILRIGGGIGPSQFSEVIFF